MSTPSPPVTPSVRPDSDETVCLLERFRAGDQRALGELLARYRDGLRGFIDLHLDRALRARVDPSDVVQDTQVIIARRLPDYLDRRPMPFHLWARLTAQERLWNVRRQHYALIRDVRREAAAPDSSSAALAERFVSAGTTPSEVMEARERAEQLARAIDQLRPRDREVLLLRHVEELPHDEIAQILRMPANAERQRYGRALFRLSKAMSRLAATGGPS
jgi:RNA polymerase sigma-70 factor, ECF subfamily